MPAEKELSESEIKAQVVEKKNQVDSLAQSGNVQEALRVAVANPPKTKSEETKALAASIAAKALGRVAEAKIDTIVNAFSEDERNNLMKYVYKSMEITEASCPPQTLLKWHEALVKKCGVGIVMRTLVDRRI